MKGAVAVFLCCVILCVLGDEEPSVQDNVSQEDKENLNTILDFMACVDEGKCSPRETNVEQISEFDEQDVHGYKYEVPIEPVAVPLQEPNHPDISEVKSEYFNLCERFHWKLEELESRHPELRILKVEFMERLNVHASKFTTVCDEGESLVIKMLDLIIFVAQQLKEDFAYLEHPKEIPVVEIVAKENVHEFGFVGSIRGIPGVDFPNYTEIPITSFSCADKAIPGFYADLETGCQVFHVCYEHRRESFLCPIGTIFNQPILACDYWYSANCSLTPLFEKVHIEDLSIPIKETVIEEVIETVSEEIEPSEEELEDLVKFMPVKAKIVEFPKEPEGKPVVSTIVGVKEVATKILGEVITTSTKVVAKPISEPKVVKVVPEVIEPITKPLVVKIVPKVVIPIIKPLVVKEIVPEVIKPVPETLKVPIFPKVVKPFPFKMVKLSFKPDITPLIPLTKAKVAVAAAVPVVKAKVAAAAAVPVVKAKVVSAAAVPVVKAKVVSAAAVPVVKAKFITASAVPISKAKLLKVAAPLFKVKATSAVKSVAKSKLLKAKLAAVPAVKVKKVATVLPFAKVAAVKPKLVVPLVKAKLVKSAAISPLTKKALAVGYLKLMKAKKLALMG